MISVVTLALNEQRVSFKGGIFRFCKARFSRHICALPHSERDGDLEEKERLPRIGPAAQLDAVPTTVCSSVPLQLGRERQEDKSEMFDQSCTTNSYSSSWGVASLLRLALCSPCPLSMLGEFCHSGVEQVLPTMMLAGVLPHLSRIRFETRH